MFSWLLWVHLQEYFKTNSVRQGREDFPWKMHFLNSVAIAFEMAMFPKSDEPAVAYVFHLPVKRKTVQNKWMPSPGCFSFHCFTSNKTKLHKKLGNANLSVQCSCQVMLQQCSTFFFDSLNILGIFKVVPVHFMCCGGLMMIDCALVLLYVHVKQFGCSDEIFKCGLAVFTWYHIPIRFLAKSNVTVLAVTG